MAERVAVSLAAWRLPLEQALDQAQASGARAVDVLAMAGGQVDLHTLVRDPAGCIRRLGAALRRRGLRLAALNAAVAGLDGRDPQERRRGLAQAEALARLCRALGSRVVTMYPGYLHPGSRDPGALPGLCRAWLAIGRRHGVDLAPEVHVRSVLATPEQAARLLADLPGLRLTLDPSHQAVAGLPVQAWLPLLDRVVHVHWRDAATDRLHVPWGTGAVAASPLLAALRAAGYRGWIAAEAISGDGPGPADLPGVLQSLQVRAPT